MVPAMARKAKALATTRTRARYLVTVTLPPCGLPPPASRSDRDIVLVSGRPTPCTRAVATLLDPCPVNFGDDLPVAREQRFGGAHLGAQRQLALAETVRAILPELLGAARRFRSAAAGAVGAFIHLAARAKIADTRILRRPERAGVEAIPTADAQILRMKHDAILGREDALDRADRRTGRIGAMHAGHRH